MTFFFIERNKNCERRLASRERERERWEGVGPVSNERSEREREREKVSLKHQDSERYSKRQLAMKELPHLPVPLPLPFNPHSSLSPF